MPIRILLITFFLPLRLVISTGREWGRPRCSARERRIARAERWELVRSALRSAADHGYYVFDDLMTEGAGMIDFLAVGPVGVCVVVVRDEKGDVTVDADGTLYLGHKRFEDDPKRHAEDLVDDVNAKILHTSESTYDVICFTRADIFYVGDNEEVLTGLYPTWDLPLAFAEAPREHSPADVAEIADRVREVYSRPPFVVPGRDDIQ